MDARHAHGRSNRLSLLAALVCDDAGAAPRRRSSGGDIRRRLHERYRKPTDAELWLALAVLTGTLPSSDDVITWRRRIVLDGPARLLRLRPPRRLRARSVEVLCDAVVVDAHHTTMTDLRTGIQRVTNSLVDEWGGHREHVVVAWSPGYEGMVRPSGDGRTHVIPWRSTYVLAELAVEQSRLERVQALAAFSENATAAVAFDLVPLTAPQTAARGMRGAFGRYLAALARFDRIAPISRAAADEFVAWRRMLSSAGLVGPQIRAIPLATIAPSTSATVDIRTALGLSALPIVLSVGSLEPRKNQLAVLHAAEVLWRNNRLFQLVLVGGNAWHSARLRARLRALRQAGRPVHHFERLPDADLVALYQQSVVMVFPSLHEGFGLPIVESLGNGTPVITSGFGSMREIGEPGSAFVDPRDDGGIAAVMDRVLCDHGYRASLVAAAAERSPRTWAAYADDVWAYLVEGQR